MLSSVSCSLRRFGSCKSSGVQNRKQKLLKKRSMSSRAGGFNGNGSMRSRYSEPKNEEIKGYRKGSAEREALEKELREQRGKVVKIPLIIGGEEIWREGEEKGEVVVPHERAKVLARYERAKEEDVKRAIERAMEARREWSKWSMDERLGIFMKAADLLASEKWRARMNAATMLGQSKNMYQAEIDSACELIDFWRFNVHYAAGIYEPQPQSGAGVWNRLTYRPLEGFVYAVTPFNFTAIGGNLSTAPAMLGNVVVWKPSDYAVLSNYYIMKLLEEAGLPKGVINFIPGEASSITESLISHPDFAGIHYTGSTSIFRQLFAKIGHNTAAIPYKSYPRIVGETGGKGFVFAHSSAHLPSLCTALLRGAFEYAGQKCSAASRAYIPKSLWPELREMLKAEEPKLSLGNPESSSTLVNAVIHQASFNRCKEHIEHAKKHAEIVMGGGYDDSKGFFIQPTIILTSDPSYFSLVNEIFGPILTIFVYEDSAFEDTLKLCDSSTQYSLTGSIFAQDRSAILTADSLLENAAGNYYINDKPTGAVVGQQPFGGSRASGTNDKAGSHLNLLRWLSPRTIKETFVPPTDLLYPYMKD